MPHLDEKRGAPRVTTVVPVHCRVTGHAVSSLPSRRAETSRTPEFPAKTVNVSRDGVLINSDTDLPVQTRLEVTMSAPGDGHPIRIETEVAWSRRNAMNLFGRYAAGLRVRRIADKDRALLTAFFKPLP